MEKLKAGDILYHANYVEIQKISLEECFPGKDFGKGFYLTKYFDQAKKFIGSALKRGKENKKIPNDVSFGYVNSYRLISLDDILEYDFQEANVNWLHYVAGNRDDQFFVDEVKELSRFNVIGGKIANDRTAATLNGYLDFLYGVPGDDITDKTCFGILLPNRLEGQYCFKDEKAIKMLQFIGSKKVTI